jgi:hypothetical protein
MKYCIVLGVCEPSGSIIRFGIIFTNSRANGGGHRNGGTTIMRTNAASGRAYGFPAPGIAA